MEDSLEQKLNTCLLINQKLLERIQKLEEKNEALEKRIADLEKEITGLRLENDFMQNRFERLANDFNKKPSNSIQASRKINAPNEIKPTRFEKFSAQTETTPPSNPHIVLSKKENPAPPKTVYERRPQKPANTINTPKSFSAGEDFLRDYNIWQSKTDGFEKINARKDFIAKYKVRYFNCVNYNERMNQPKLPPIFEESSASGEYWAIQTAGNIFKVVPNVKSYNDNYHVARAMCEVFDSNFDVGNYSNIQLERAAEFTNSGQNWTLVKKGKLILR